MPSGSTAHSLSALGAERPVPIAVALSGGPIRNTMGQFLVFHGRSSSDEFRKLLDISIASGDNTAAFFSVLQGK